ncbi:hypothetical protein [Rhodococcus sp. NPDC049939]|uniref:hypothetical protein n=1 Tax=Rhodococcus sp. NPDC049939 TaxID=3155511 RepID=UPI0033D59A96
MVKIWMTISTTLSEMSDELMWSPGCHVRFGSRHSMALSLYSRAETALGQNQGKPSRKWSHSILGLPVVPRRIPVETAA